MSTTGFHITNNQLRQQPISQTTNWLATATHTRAGAYESAHKPTLAAPGYSNNLLNQWLRFCSAMAESVKAIGEVKCSTWIYTLERVNTRQEHTKIDTYIHKLLLSGIRRKLCTPQSSTWRFTTPEVKLLSANNDDNDANDNRAHHIFVLLCY